MKIISIDVGIKNLAYCLLDFQQHANTSSSSSALNINIIKWDSINLCEKEGKGMTKNVCHDNDCKKKAKYYFYIDAECAELDHKMYICSQHAKKIENKQEINEEKKIQREQINKYFKETKEKLHWRKIYNDFVMRCEDLLDSDNNELNRDEILERVDGYYLSAKQDISGKNPKMEDKNNKVLAIITDNRHP